MAESMASSRFLNKNRWGVESQLSGAFLANKQALAVGHKPLVLQGGRRWLGSSAFAGAPKGAAALQGKGIGKRAIHHGRPAAHG